MGGGVRGWSELGDHRADPGLSRSWRASHTAAVGCRLFLVQRPMVSAPHHLAPMWRVGNSLARVLAAHVVGPRWLDGLYGMWLAIPRGATGVDNSVTGVAGVVSGATPSTAENSGQVVPSARPGGAGQSTCRIEPFSTVHRSTVLLASRNRLEQRPRDPASLCGRGVDVRTQFHFPFIFQFFSVTTHDHHER